MTLGGILYTAIPFNGWYADTEVLRGESNVTEPPQSSIMFNDQKLTKASLVPCLWICAMSVYILCKI